MWLALKLAFPRKGSVISFYFAYRILLMFNGRFAQSFLTIKIKSEIINLLRKYYGNEYGK